MVACAWEYRLIPRRESWSFSSLTCSINKTKFSNRKKEEEKKEKKNGRIPLLDSVNSRPDLAFHGFNL